MRMRRTELVFFSNLDEFKDTDGNPYSLEKIWPESAVATSGDTDTNSAKLRTIGMIFIQLLEQQMIIKSTLTIVQMNSI